MNAHPLIAAALRDVRKHEGRAVLPLDALERLAARADDIDGGAELFRFVKDLLTLSQLVAGCDALLAASVKRLGTLASVKESRPVVAKEKPKMMPAVPKLGAVGLRR